MHAHTHTHTKKKKNMHTYIYKHVIKKNIHTYIYKHVIQMTCMQVPQQRVEVSWSDTHVVEHINAYMYPQTRVPDDSDTNATAQSRMVAVAAKAGGWRLACTHAYMHSYIHACIHIYIHRHINMHIYEHVF
jgi:hypothetical protein